MPDHLGNVNQVVNTQTGQVVQQVSYDEFGNVLFDSNPDFTPFGFAGGLYDSQSKLVRFGAREYDSGVGRWTTKDPIGFNGRDRNLYAYCISDPVNLIDPTGHMFDVVADILIAILDFADFNVEGSKQSLETDALYVAAAGPIGSMVGANVSSLVRKIGLRMDRFGNLAKTTGKKVVDKAYMGRALDFTRGIWDGVREGFAPQGMEVIKSPTPLKKSGVAYGAGYGIGFAVGNLLQSLIPGLK